MASSTSTPTVTYGGVAMTNVLSLDNGVNRIDLFRLLAPAPGAQTVTVTLSGLGRRFLAGAITYTGAYGFGEPVSAQSAGSTVASVSVVCTAADLVVDLLCQAGTSAVSLQTERYAANFGSAGNNNRGAGSTAAGGASVGMGYTFINAVDWTLVGLAVLALPRNSVLDVLSNA